MSVAVRRAMSGLHVRWSASTENGRCATQDDCIHLTLLRRSEHLKHVYDSLRDGEEQGLAMQGAWIRAWLDFVRQSNAAVNIATPTDKLATTLQAADFLIDLAAVSCSSNLLASRLMDSSNTSLAYSVVEAMLKLPVHMILLILRAALSAGVTAEVFLLLRSSNFKQGHLTVQSWIVHELLARLPSTLWPLVLTAASHTVDTTGVLCLENITVGAADAAIAATAQLPQLTSFVVKGCCLPAVTGSLPVHSIALGDAAAGHPEAALAHLSSLESLRLERCSPLFLGRSHRSLVAAIPAMTRLTLLSLKKSAASGGALSALWANLGALQALISLDVTDVGLVYATKPYNPRLAQCRIPGPWNRSPEEIAEDNQCFLQFSHGLGSLTALQELLLSRNRLEGGGWEILAPLAAQLPLRTLELERCLRTVFPFPHNAAHDTAPPGFAQLERLTFSCDYKVDVPPAVRWPCTGLRHLRGAVYSELEHSLEWLSILGQVPFRLESLEIQEQDLVRLQSLSHLGMCLGQWTGLTWLELHFTLFAEELLPADPHDLPAVPAALPESLLEPLGRLTALQHLCLPSKCKLDELAPALSRLTALTLLSVPSPILEDHDEGAAASLVTTCFYQLVALEELRVSFDSDVACASLVPAIASLTRLTHLDVDDTQLGDAFAEEYAECLATLVRLKELRMASSYIGAEGIAGLAGVWPRLPQLERLDMSVARPGRLGAEKLAEALPQLTALQELHIQDSELCDDAARAIADALPSRVVLFQW